MSVVKFGYWNIRGLMQPIRLLNEYLGIKWEEKRYDAKPLPDGTFDKSEWFNVKPNMGLTFPNLPYMIDEETNIKLTQSDAILRYLSMKYSPELLGKNLKDQAEVNMIVGVLGDLKSQMGRVAYGPADNYKENLSGLRVSAATTIANILHNMGTRPFVAADYVTFVDFICYELFDIIKIMIPDILQEVGNLRNQFDEYIKRIGSLPKIEAYRKSSQFIERPINGATACFK